MFLVQIKVDGKWITHDEFETMEASKVCESYLNQDYEHLETRIVTEEDDRESYIIFQEVIETGGRLFEIDQQYYSGIEPVELEPEFSNDIDDAVRFPTGEAAIEFLARFREKFPHEENKFLDILSINW